tara:strand:+ start:3780 stop:5963 length:2184 start_codon:yes stop_codon:yes gene_type:complete
MAEIGVYRSQQIFNRPIGVVNPSTAGIRAQEARVSQLGSFTSLMLKEAEQSEIKKGREWAKTFEVFDENQKLQRIEIPKEFSNVATEEAEKDLKIRYTNALKSNLLNKAKELRSDVNQTSSSFEEAYDTYLQSIVDTVSDDYKELAREMGLTIRDNNSHDLILKESVSQRKTDAALELRDVIDSYNEIDWASLTPSQFGKEITRQREQLKNYATRYNDIVGVTFYANQETLLNKRIGHQYINDVLVNMRKYANNQNMTLQEKSLFFTQTLNDLAVEIDIGQDGEGLSKELQNALNFNPAILDSLDLNEAARNEFSSEFSTTQGRIIESLNSEIKQERIANTVDRLNSDQDISSDNAKLILETSGVFDAEDIINNLNTIFVLNPETGSLESGEGQFVYQILQTRGGLPPQIASLLDEENLILLADRNPDYFNAVINMFDLATTTYLTDTATGEISRAELARGLSNTQRSNLAFLSSVQELSIAGFTPVKMLTDLQRYNSMDSDTKRDIKERVKFDKNINSIANKYTVEEFEFVRDSRLLEVLAIRSETEKNFKENLNQVTDYITKKLFVESDYTRKETAFAPERLFTSKTQRQLMEKDVLNVIRAIDNSVTKNLIDNLDGKPELGKNLFLLPIDESGALTKYFITDANGMALFDNRGQFLQYDSAVTYKQILKAEGQNVEELRKQAREARENARQNQINKFGTPEDAEEIQETLEDFQTLVDELEASQ